MDSDLHVDLAATRERTLLAVGEAAEIWNATWEPSPGGGSIHLPILAGIRHGRARCRVEVDEIPEGSAVTLRVERVEYRVNRSAVALLALGAFGGIMTAIWPLSPDRLLRFVPPGIALAVGAWLLVASRLTTAGPKEFLDTIAELTEEDEDPDQDSPANDPVSPIDP